MVEILCLLESKQQSKNVFQYSLNHSEENSIEAIILSTEWVPPPPPPPVYGEQMLGFRGRGRGEGCKQGGTGMIYFVKTVMGR